MKETLLHLHRYFIIVLPTRLWKDGSLRNWRDIQSGWISYVFWKVRIHTLPHF